MATPPQKISILLNGGIDEQASPELAGPVASQGASITLRESVNTRLSPIRGSCTRAPDAPTCATSTTPIHGMASSAAGRNTIAFRRPGVAPSRVLNAAGQDTGAGAGNLTSPLDSTSPQNAYIPSQITRAGAIPSVAATTPPSTAYDPTTGWYWTVYQGYPDTNYANDRRVYVTVSDASGGVIVPATAVLASAGMALGKPWLAVTCHGTNGVRLWVQTANSILCYPLNVSGNVVTTPGSSFNVPCAVNNSTCAVISGLLTNYDGTPDTTNAVYAYVISASSGSANNATIQRINVATGGTASAANLVGALAGDNGKVSVCFSRISGTYYVGVAAHTAAGTLTATVYSDFLGSLSTNTDASAYLNCDVAVQFLFTPLSGASLVVLRGNWNGTFSGPALSGCQTDVYTLSMSGNTLTKRGIIPWSVPRSHGTVIRFSDTEQYPVFDFVRRYGTLSDSPIGGDYVLDPSVEMWLFGSPTLWSPVARYGVVRFVVASVRVTHYDSLPHGIAGIGTKIYATYLKDIVQSSGQVDYAARYVEVDFAAFQPPVAQDKDGVALIGGALPAQWDGTEVVEIGGPLHAPKIRVDNSGGTGPVMAAGAYRVAAQYSWTDAGGLEHRSTPAVVNWTAPGGTSPLVYVTGPDSLRRGTTQTPVDVILYCSAVNQPVLYRQPTRPENYLGLNALFAGSLAAVDTSRQPIFSTGASGEEQTPQPPPPAQDLAIVNDRLWVLDAEVRSRAVYSKKRIAGKGFEFYPGYEVILPSGVGKTIAVREWQGNTVIFTELAIFVVSGGGPDNTINNPTGGSFSPPVQVAAIGARNRESVLVTPKGILFQRADDIMLFAGGEPQFVQGVQPTLPVTSSFLLRDNDEAVLLGTGGELVWNYVLNRWTKWYATPSNVATAHTLAYDSSKVLLLAVNRLSVFLLDDAVLSQIGPMSWATDWIVLGGDFQDHVLLQWVMFSARSKSPHGIQIEVFTNYDESTNPKTYSTRTWTVAQLSALSSPLRYTLRHQPQRSDTRAVKVRVTEQEVSGTRDGVQPICLTFVYSLEAAIHENGLPQGSTK